MSILTTRIKKILVFIFSVAIFSLINVPVNAQGNDATTTTTTTTGTAGTSSAGGASSTTSGGGGGDEITLLAEIAQYTNGILQAVNNLPAYMTDLAKLAVSLLAPDTSDTTAQLQSTFATYSSQLQASSAAQISLQQNLTSAFFGTTATALTLPNANDLAFTTLLGSPFFSPDPRTQNGQPPVNAAFNYLENIAGTNYSHVMPKTGWAGAAADRTRYGNFYNSVSAVQTYDAYVLSQLYTDIQNGIPASQSQLLQQASTSDWFAQIASEEIGIVLRQILMYNSQTFVLLSELLQTEKQMAATQAMTNTLLIIEGATNEDTLLQKAVKKTAG